MLNHAAPRWVNQGTAYEHERVLAEAARYERKLRRTPPRGVFSTLGFAGACAAFGALGGPIGIPLGMMVGAVVGAALGFALADERIAHEMHDHELDDLIGVTSGRLGFPQSERSTQSRIGAFSAASMGVGAGTGVTAEGGPIPRADA